MCRLIPLELISAHALYCILHVCVCVCCILYVQILFHIVEDMVTINHQAEIQFSPRWVLLQGDFKWIYLHFPAELCVCAYGVGMWTCGGISECLCTCAWNLKSVYPPLCICLHVCVLFQWWQTAEVLFPEELDNLSSGESVSTFSMQPAQTGQQSKSMCG